MELDMDKVVKRLSDAGVPAYVEQTGGGTATLFAGRLRPVARESVAWYPASGAEGPDATVVDETVTEDRWDACAGPGWFEGPMGWINPRADLGDFCIGLDDDGESEPVFTDDSWTEDDVVEAILRVVGRSDRETFLRAVRNFAEAGRRLSEAWDGESGFNADEAAPLPADIRPPLSFDEWVEAFTGHYIEALSEGARA